MEGVDLDYFDLHSLIDMVSGPNRNPLIDSYVSNAELVARAPGSRIKHQAWVGGYLDHVVHAANYALLLDKINSDIVGNDESGFSDIVLVMLLHDFGKIVKYNKIGLGWDYIDSPNNVEHDFLRKTIEENEFQLNSIHQNALEFIHGEGESYNLDKRLMSPLAVLCHQADIWSARYCPNNPLPEGNPWNGAYRHVSKDNLIGYIKELNVLRFE